MLLFELLLSSKYFLHVCEKLMLIYHNNSLKVHQNLNTNLHSLAFQRFLWYFDHRQVP